MGTALNGSPADHVAIVTGGSRGVGRAAIGRLAAGGYAVVVNYLHDQRAAEAAVEAVLAGNGNAVAVRADIADDLDVDRLFAETIAAFGGIDVVVHAAGSRVATSAVTKAGLDEFDALLRINTRATFVVNREAARHMCRQLVPAVRGLLTGDDDHAPVPRLGVRRHHRQRASSPAADQLVFGDAVLGKKAFRVAVFDRVG